MLAKTAGKYCFGDEVTLADVFLAPQVYNARRWGVDVDAYPTIAKVDAALGELDAFKKAHADNQPDKPKDAK
jgi:glutathione S-transferase